MNNSSTLLILAKCCCFLSDGKPCRAAEYRAVFNLGVLRIRRRSPLILKFRQ